MGLLSLPAEVVLAQVLARTLVLESGLELVLVLELELVQELEQAWAVE